MEKLGKEVALPLNFTEEYSSDWDYNPGELLRLAVWHKKELPEEAIKKIISAFDNILGRDNKPGRWMLDEKEFENLAQGYAQCPTIPSEFEDDLIEIMKQFKKNLE
jgi:hypothetical protein